ncbi:sialin-like isoform X2 [Mytilus edulis]|uniref:sialin-like isoform X2 n=1 Tax=Mytilus edulis TaxID=6550 RepID=UPI0039EF074C
MTSLLNEEMTNASRIIRDKDRTENTEDETPTFDTGDNENSSYEHLRTPLWGSSRFALAVLGFFGFVNSYALLVNMSVAIVCMVNRTDTLVTKFNKSLLNKDDFNDCVDFSGERNASDVPGTHRGGEFNWDTKVQGFILGGFFWGYLVSQIPAGWLATRFGGKRVFGWSIFIATICTMLTPIGAKTDYRLLIVLRVIVGMCNGTVFPAMHALFGHWSPPLERSRLTALTYSGTQAGIVITFPLGAYLCQNGFGGGWPSIFYVCGMASFLWFVLWMFFVSGSPVEHKRISHEEKEYIIASLVESAHKKNRKNGILSALPYIAFWAMINVTGWVADFVRVRQLMSTTLTRKAFDAFGKIVPAVLMIALGYVECSATALAVVLLVLSVGLSGFQYSGFIVNHVDIAPAYAGILFGISNALSAIGGFVSPIIVGEITKEAQTRTEWQFVFYMSAGIYIFGAIFYVIFASGDLQPWAVETDPIDINNEENSGSDRLESMTLRDLS